MQRKLLFTLFYFFHLSVLCQDTLKSTSQLKISCAVKHETTITLSDLKKYPEVAIGDVVITNHLGEKKGVAKSMIAIQLKKLLATIEFASDTPKQLSEFFLTFVASDGYKVVFSWNEIFNSPTGDSSFIVTQKDGKKLNDLPESLCLLRHPMRKREEGM